MVQLNRSLARVRGSTEWWPESSHPTSRGRAPLRRTMPPKTTIAKKKRPSPTDQMHNDVEKILSGVERGLMKLLDSDKDGAELSRIWPDAPKPCIVVVNTARFNYVYKIKERLKNEYFHWAPGVKMWYCRKVPGQLTLQERADLYKRVIAEM